MEAEIPRTRGTTLLLEHCAALDWPGEERPSAMERLGDAVGEDFARLLVRCLVGPGGRSG
jgi:hypothetical protein